MNQINQIFANNNINVAAQYLQTTPEIGYVVIDVATDDASAILKELKEIDGTLKARILL